MQVYILPDTYAQASTVRVAKESDTKLQAYLQSISWETNTCTNARLASMLAASCLRFLAGCTDVFFVVGLSREIQGKYRKTMNLSLQYSTEILSEVAQMLKNKRLLLTDREEINELVNDAQEVITKRRYSTASTS